MKHNLKYFLNHRKDILLHRGFDYRGHILEKSLSGSLYLEENRKNILKKLELPISHIVDSIKYIKKCYNWRFDLDFNEFN